MVWKTEITPEGGKERKKLKRIRHLLMAEDDEALARQLAAILTENDYRVVHVSRIREAVEKVENEAFDLLLLDVRLADGDIVRFIDQVRTRPGALNAEAPIILMSGGLEESVILSVLGRIQGALVKPFDPGQLLAKIGLAIESHRREVESRRRRIASEGLVLRGAPKRASG